MMNIIRADIYRIVRGKALYITLLVLLALNVLMVSTSEAGTVGIQMWELEKSLSGGVEVVEFNGMNIPYVLCTNMDNLAYFLLPLFIIVAAPMFSHGTIKNSLSCGMSRTRLYFSKLILSSGMCLVLELFHMVSGIAIATVMRGYGGSPDGAYWLNVLKICSAQLLLLLALNCVGVFLVFTTKRTAAVNAAYIAVCVVPAIIIMLLVGRNPDFIKLYDYDLLGNIKKLGYLPSLESVDIFKAFGTGLFYILASTAAGVLIFRKAEIK